MNQNVFYPCYDKKSILFMLALERILIHMKVILGEDKELAVAAAAENIAHYMATDTWLFISGGSSFQVFEKLDSILSDDQKSLTRLLLVDERYGSEGHDNSNWNLFKSIDTAKYASIYPVLDDSESIQGCASEYDEVVQMAFESDSQTVAILGIGSDSHIAGIKPMKKNLFDKTFLDTNVSSYSAADYDRITLTPSALMQLGLRVCFVAGSDKVPVVASLAIDRPIHDSPVHILKDLDNTVIYNVT